MKKTIFLSSIALVFCACSGNGGYYSVPEIPEPSQNQSFSEYLNSYQYPFRCFGHGPHAYCIQKPLKTIYSKGNEVLLQYDNLVLSDQSLNLYHNAYRYCEAIGGKSIIKKEAFQSMLKHKEILFNSDNPQVEEFLKIKDNYSSYEIPDGFFECIAEDNSFEITHKMGEFSYIDGSNRFAGDYKDDVAALFVIKFKKAQKESLVFRDNYYRSDEIDEIAWIKLNASKKEVLDDKTFYHKILPLYHICKARYNGTPYIIGDATENKAMLLGDYLLNSAKYGKGVGEFGDYTISCVNNTQPFTFKKTFNGDLERRVDGANSDYWKYYRKPAAYYEVSSVASDLKELESPFENGKFFNKLILKAYPNNYANNSTVLHNYDAYIIKTPDYSNGYISIIAYDKVSKKDDAVYTYAIENNNKRYIGKVGEKEISKAKEMLASNSDNIIKNCSLNLDNFKIANYTVYCQNNVIYIKNGDKIHYVKKI